MADVEGVSQKNPAPSEVRPHFEARLRGGLQRLRISIGIRSLKPVKLVKVGVLEHRSVVVIVWSDIFGVIIVKPSDEALNPRPCLLDFRLQAFSLSFICGQGVIGDGLGSGERVGIVSFGLQECMVCCAQVIRVVTTFKGRNA